MVRKFDNLKFLKDQQNLDVTKCGLWRNFGFCSKFGFLTKISFFGPKFLRDQHNLIWSLAKFIFHFFMLNEIENLDMFSNLNCLIGVLKFKNY